MKKRFVSFGAVGIVNTGLNILVFNLLLLVGISVGWSNFFSLCISIVIAYVLSSYFVFGDRTNDEAKRTRFIKFILVNIFTLFVIHQVLLLFFVYIFPFPGDLAYQVVGYYLKDFASAAFIVINTAKVLAVGGSMVTNYILYDKFVFKSAPESR